MIGVTVNHRWRLVHDPLNDRPGEWIADCKSQNQHYRAGIEIGNGNGMAGGSKNGECDESSRSRHPFLGYRESVMHCPLAEAHSRAKSLALRDIFLLRYNSTFFRRRRYVLVKLNAALKIGRRHIVSCVYAGHHCSQEQQSPGRLNATIYLRETRRRGKEGGRRKRKRKEGRREEGRRSVASNNHQSVIWPASLAKRAAGLDNYDTLHGGGGGGGGGELVISPC